MPKPRGANEWQSPQIDAEKANCVTPNTIKREPTTLSIERATWRAFQAACKARGLVPSEQVEQWMRAQLATWQSTNEPDATKIGEHPNEQSQ